MWRRLALHPLGLAEGHGTGGEPAPFKKTRAQFRMAERMEMPGTIAAIHSVSFPRKRGPMEQRIRGKMGPRLRGGRQSRTQQRRRKHARNSAEGLCPSPRSLDARGGAGLSVEAAAPDHSVRAGRQRRHRGAARRAEARRPARQAGAGGEPRRRRRHHRLRACDRSAAGWPHPGARLAGARGQSAYQQAQLRHRQGTLVRRLAGQRTKRVHGASVGAGDNGEGADRACQGKARHAAFRARRRRQLHAHRVGAVLHDGWHRHGDGAVQGRWPGDDRRAWAATASS